MAAWINLNSVEGRQAILSKVPEGNYYLLVDGDRLSFENNLINFGAFKGSTQLASSTWYFVAATWDGSETRLYVNGILDGSDPVDWVGAPNTDAVKIGQRGRNDDLFGGLIDEVEIYNRALSASEIQAIFDAGNSGNRPEPLSGLISRWQGEGSASDVKGEQGLPSRITRANGAVFTMSYDQRGNLLTSTEEATNATTTFTYEPVFNQVSSVTDPDGNATAINYDASGNPIEIIDALGTRTVMAYADPTCPGQLTSVTAAQGLPEENITTFEYDPVTCNLTQTTDPLLNRTVLAYDAAGNVTQSSDAEGRLTRFQYDVLNRLTKVIDATNSAPDPVCGTASVTCYDYDDQGNLIQVTDAQGSMTTFEYDTEDRLTKTTDPLGNFETFDYDDNGNLISTTDRSNQMIDFEYDVGNQLIEKTLLPGAPGEAVTSFGYDLTGNLTSVADPDSFLTMTYDDLSRLDTVFTSGSPNQLEVSISYTYDKNGNRLTMTDPERVTSSVYDELNRLTDLTNPSLDTVSFEYDNLSRRTQLSMPTGVTTVYSYDDASQLLSLEHTLGASMISNFSYTYDKVGNRKTFAQDRSAVSVASPLNYLYDDLNRLIEGTHPLPLLPQEIFDYDPVGNRELRDGQSFTSIFDAANRLLEDEDFCYDYDDNGNLTSKEAKVTGACGAAGQLTEYDYDPENQLIEVRVNGTPVGSYRYDGLGRRIEKDASGAVTRYIYDNEDLLLEFDGANTLIARYTHGPGIDEPLIMERDLDTSGTFEVTEQFFYHVDGLGSVTELTDSAGLVARAYVYDSFGQIAQEVGTLANPFTFTGREIDEESGLYFYRARYYDPRTGRFTSEDPVGLGGGDPNFYQYVLNNPISFVDPTGEGPKGLAACIIVQAIGVGPTIINIVSLGFEVGEINQEIEDINRCIDDELDKGFSKADFIEIGRLSTKKKKLEMEKLRKLLEGAKAEAYGRALEIPLAPLCLFLIAAF